MKIVGVLAVVPAARALSTKTTSAGALLEAASSRNVTQMAGLLQHLVQESLEVEGDGVEQLEPTIKRALEVIRGNLVKNIRDSLAREHKVDQDDIMRNVECFTKCAMDKRDDESKCKTFKDEAEELSSQHASCRTTLLADYVEKIEECNALDDWVAAFKLEPKIKEFCVYDAAYVCHMKECPESSPCTPAIDAKFGNWLQGIITSATSGWNTWSEYNGKCKAAYHAYIKKDAECDVKQRSFELKKCGERQCRDMACNEQYAACRGRCEDSYHSTNKRVECAEKDRKIDWSATEKIECFLRILLASPNSTALQEHCEDKSKCLSEWRTNEFNKCNSVCEEVDYDSGSYSQHARRGSAEGEGLDYNTFWHESQQPLRQHADMQVYGDSTWGVNTTHRVSDKTSTDQEKRCSQHLDIDFQPIPDCEPCAEEAPMPCSEVFHAKYYQRFTLTDEVTELADKDYRKCHTESPGEHTQKWAYNLCECKDCGKPADDFCPRPSTCGPITKGNDVRSNAFKEVKLSSEKQCQRLCSHEEKCQSFSFAAQEDPCGGPGVHHATCRSQAKKDQGLTCFYVKKEFTEECGKDGCENQCERQQWGCYSQQRLPASCEGQGPRVVADQCTGNDCRSTATCPEGTWVEKCESEPANAGDGIEVSADGRSCTAFGDKPENSIRAIVTCSEKQTISVPSDDQYLDSQDVSAECPSGYDVRACHCHSPWYVSTICGGESSFEPNEGKCTKSIPSSPGRRRNTQSGAGARIWAVCEKTMSLADVQGVCSLSESTLEKAGVCHPISTTPGRCGPKFGNGRCDKSTRDWAIFCNAHNGWCGVTPSHEHAQEGDEWDADPAACKVESGSACAPLELGPITHAVPPNEEN